MALLSALSSPVVSAEGGGFTHDARRALLSFEARFDAALGRGGFSSGTCATPGCFTHDARRTGFFFSSTTLSGAVGGAGAAGGGVGATSTTSSRAAAVAGGAFGAFGGSDFRLATDDARLPAFVGIGGGGAFAVILRGWVGAAARGADGAAADTPSSPSNPLDTRLRFL